jgi:chromosome segregation ATPase
MQWRGKKTAFLRLYQRRDPPDGTRWPPEWLPPRRAWSARERVSAPHSCAHEMLQRARARAEAEAAQAAANAAAAPSKSPRGDSGPSVYESALRRARENRAGRTPIPRPDRPAPALPPPPSNAQDMLAARVDLVTSLAVRSSSAQMEIDRGTIKEGKELLEFVSELRARLRETTETARRETARREQLETAEAERKAVVTRLMRHNGALKGELEEVTPQMTALQSKLATAQAATELAREETAEVRAELEVELQVSAKLEETVAQQQAEATQMRAECEQLRKKTEHGAATAEELARVAADASREQAEATALREQLAERGREMDALTAQHEKLIAQASRHAERHKAEQSKLRDDSAALSSTLTETASDLAEAQAALLEQAATLAASQQALAELQASHQEDIQRLNEAAAAEMERTQMALRGELERSTQAQIEAVSELLSQ